MGDAPPGGGPPTPAPAFAGGRRRAALTALLAVAMGVAITPGVGMGVLSRFLIADLHFPRGHLGWASGVASLVGALAAPWVGRATDRIGGRASLLWLFALAGGGIVGMAAAPGFGFLLVASLFVGVGLAWAPAATNRLVVDHVPGGRRGVVTGVKQAGETAAIALAGAVLPSMALALGWRWALAVTAAVPVLGGLASWRLLTREPTAGGRPSAGRVRAPLPGWAWWLAAYALLMAAGGGSVTLYLPLYAQEEAGLSVTAAGAVMVVSGIAATLGRVLWSHLTERSRRLRRSLVWVALSTAGAVLLILAAAPSRPLVVWAGGLLWGASGLSAGSVIMLVVVAAPDESAAGRMSGVVLAGFNAGFALGPPLFGYAVDHAGGYHLGLAVVAGVFATAAAVVGLSPRHWPGGKDEPG